MRRVYHYFGGHAVTIGIAGGWVGDQIKMAGYETHSRSRGMTRPK
ncbi:hypothetical protein Godav_001964 [Gossypium davidsonii]|uniref:Uncharacterized protein n=1 Tax=Gossypium davidsonii TaxID=34287 RepID=A0A7J8T4M5_GOSDV|nr:hypothetical protein [Gossypium davidsonii]